MSTTELAPPTADQDEFHIRLASRSDLPAMEWEDAYIHFRRVYERAFERAQRGDALLWVMGNGQHRLVGQVFVLLRSEYDPEVADGHRRAFIHSFRVRPELRSRGLGARLLHSAEHDLQERGYEWTYLHVAHENLAAIRFYERHGYRQLGPVSGEWSYEDHLGRQRHVLEPGWRMLKRIV